MADEFEGYRVGDITYCLVVDTTDCFPVRIAKVGQRFLDAVPLHEDPSDAEAPEFRALQANRRFQRPKLPSWSRFGGCDERPVNSARESGPELRLLPTHYATTTGAVIRKRHAADPERWPLPTGLVYERWFKEE
ncbi:MAG: hypothetical protein ACO1SX_01005 [Actinomycetota bacterium]